MYCLLHTFHFLLASFYRNHFNSYNTAVTRCIETPDAKMDRPAQAQVVGLLRDTPSTCLVDICIHLDFYEL